MRLELFKIMHLRIVKLLVIGVLMLSCSKSKEDKMDDFVTTYNSSKKPIKNNTVTLVKSERTSENQVTLNFSTHLTADNMEPSVIKASLIDLIGKLLWSNAENKKMLNDGVSFAVIVKGADGNILLKEMINKSGMTSTKIDLVETKNRNQLNQMLEFFNNSLPITDSLSGVKITQIALGSKNDVIYTAIVHKKKKKAVQRSESKAFIKRDMARDQQLKKVLTDLKTYDISSLKYQYRDDSGKLLQEVEMKEKDFN